MRTPPLLLLLLGLTATGPAVAHDLWVQSRDFWLPRAGTVPISILVGHGKDRENWGIRGDKIVRLRTIAPDGSSADLTPLVKRSSTAQAIPLRFAAPGTHMVVMESNHSPSDLAAPKFNEFLKEEGLTPAIEHRERTGATGNRGRELFSRRAKALVQVGKARPAAKSPVTSQLGLTLEIVPERSPYLLGSGEALPVRVFYEGKPLAGALVKLTNLDADEKPLSKQLTDASGRARFSVPRKGKWLLNVIWTKPISGNPKAEFETVFSSLAFGYPA